MPSFSAAQLALTEVLRQRLAAAGCQYGRFDVSEPGTYLSLSGQKADGKTLYFWEFSQKFHELVNAYLQEQYDEYTSQLTIQIDVATAQAQYVRTPKLVPELATAATTAPTLLPTHDPTPYGLALAAQVAARLDLGTALAYSCRGYGGMGLARGAGAEYQYGEVWDGTLSPSKTFPTWAAFVAWLAAQSDFSLAGPDYQSASYRSTHRPITRRRLTELVQLA
ncbi:hypothetical protein FNT36_01560 [Hymenobacter setariae]|uniref:Uncharacterized protein n=1 Tax=Hymenobacter setariae TaxID=2594794 RepID=A0A558C299_9BACT|nr:hypothetical protein [Hymenobacter setariae]TVT42807.1 hypothetical protein FNT36_01560 [Hymenobacter setariae]